MVCTQNTELLSIPLLLMEESEVVIMIAVGTEETHGSDQDC
jgi:hypothetical protein